MFKLNFAVGTLAFLTTAQFLYPTISFAQNRSMQISITDHGFVPISTMSVLNQQVTIHAVNTGHKVHQFSIPYYRIFTQDLAPGQSSEIEFAPWTAGRLEMISDPSGAGNPEFTGSFIVTDHK